MRSGNGAGAAENLKEETNMRRTILTAVAATMLWTQANASTVSFKAGYSSITGEIRYNHEQQTTTLPFYNNTSMTEDISAAVGTFGGSVMADINDMFSVGFSVGASTAGEFEFDDSSTYTPAGTNVDPDEGDRTTFNFSKLPIMARLEASMAAGPGTASLGLGVGAVIFGWNVETLDQNWWDGTSHGSADNNRNFTTDKTYGHDINYSVGATPAFTFEIAPAYHYKVSSKLSIGLEIPLQFISETIVGGGHFEYNAGTPTGNVNPEYSREIELGGMQFGANLVIKVVI